MPSIHRIIKAFISSLILFAFIIGANNSFAQKTKESYFEDNRMKYEDCVYVKNIKTVLLHPSQWELSIPIIKLNTDEKLLLTFDDLDAGYKEYSYSLIHCNAQWQPTDMTPNEYLDTYTEDRISDYASSASTLQSFTQYKIEFPNDNMKPLISGNYIVKAYPNGDPEHPILTKRFMIFEDLLSIGTNIHKSFDPNSGNQTQEVDFDINTATFPIANTYDDLKVVVMQNDRWDNAITGLKPRFIDGAKLSYDYDGQNSFLPGNEFRHIDLKTIRYVTDRVWKRTSDSTLYNIYLKPDIRRTFTEYMTDKDIDGKFIIRNQDGMEVTTDADYVWVHFFLPYDAPMVDGTIHILGAMTGWKVDKSTRLEYNYADRCYETTLLLKQGYYNYLYGYVPNKSTKADVTFIEGNHDITENEYTILAYYKKPGTLYDRIVGYKKANSGR